MADFIHLLGFLLIIITVKLVLDKFSLCYALYLEAIPGNWTIGNTGVSM